MCSHHLAPTPKVSTVLGAGRFQFVKACSVDSTCHRRGCGLRRLAPPVPPLAEHCGVILEAEKRFVADAEDLFILAVLPNSRCWWDSPSSPPLLLPRSRPRKPVLVWILGVCPSKNSRNKIQAITLHRWQILGEIDLPLHLASGVLGEFIGLTSHSGREGWSV